MSTLAAAHDDEEEYSSESSLTTWEASSDEDGPISSSDYAAGVGAGGGDAACAGLGVAHARRRSATRLDELLLQEAFRQDALHHGLPVTPEVVVISDSSDNEE
jgi:hypothetical protein